MKIRKGFVSNSSTSSFTCDVCGDEQMGRDIGLVDADMYQCENGHTFCRDSCIKGVKGADELIEEIGLKNILKARFQQYIEKHSQSEDEVDTIEEIQSKLIDLDNDTLDEDEIMEYLSDWFEFEYSIPESCCPICRFEVLDNDDVSAYMLKKIGQTRDQLKKEIKETFKSYAELQTFLKGN